jgi:ABC-type branched-subunit amino acid transport system ATPase component/branched-subunit amino acid ABC-type transport system permease component
MSKFLNLAISGTVSGAIYSLIASGMVLSYNATGIFNLGYGAVAFTTAFVYYELRAGLGWPIVPAAIVAVVIFAPLLGLVLDRLIFRSLARAPESAKIMATIGVLVAIPALAKWIVELLVHTFKFSIPLGNNVIITPGIGPSPQINWHLPGDITLDSNQLIVFITAVVCAIGLWLFSKHTAIGVKMRAAVDRPQLAELRGVNRGQTSAIAWVLGTSLAGLAGVVGASIFNSLDPNTYTLVMFVAATAAVLGNLRSIPIAFVGGLLLGFVQNIVAGYARFAQNIGGFNTSVPFLVLLASLAAISYRRHRRVGSATEDVPRPNYLADLPPWRRLLPAGIGILGLILYLFIIADPFWVAIATRGLALSLVFLSFVIVTGMGGMVNLAPAAFVTASGLTTGLLLDHYNVPYVLAVLGGVLGATVLGLVVALPALRLGGLALALATLALGFVGEVVLFEWSYLANGVLGWPIKRPVVGPLHFADNRTFAMGLVLLLVLITILINNLGRTSVGRAAIALRSSEPAAAMSGVSPTSVRLMLFALSAAIAGLGGALLATFDGRAFNHTYPTLLGLIWLATVVLWGVRRPTGAIVAGFVGAVFPALLAGGIHWPKLVPSFLAFNGTKSIYIPSILFGLGAIQMAKDPDGILAVMGAARYGRRRGSAASPPNRSAKVQTPFEHRAPTGSALRTVTPSFALVGVSAGYGEVEVLFDVDMELPPGSITALLGANGAGKSTLCSVIGGLVPIRSGTILFGDDVVTLTPAFRRARQGLQLIPESRGIFPGLTVEENLQLSLSPHEIGLAYDRFPLLRLRRSLVAGNLSGGEQQMLTLASVLVHPPRVMVADEPTLGLAPLVANEVLGILQELRSLGVSLLLVEEKAERVMDIADYVAVLELGRVVWSGPSASLDWEVLADSYLGSNQPTTREVGT